MVFERPEPELETVILDPSYRLALGVGAIAIPLGLLNLWLGLVVGLLAIFLAVQATVLRIHFTGTALDLYRGEKRLRTFPYADWSHWEIFWKPLPILFYFNEVNNIHFVPMLFNPQQLRDCVGERCARLVEAEAAQTAETEVGGDRPETVTVSQVEESAQAKGSTTD